MKVFALLPLLFLGAVAQKPRSCGTEISHEEVIRAEDAFRANGIVEDISSTRFSADAVIKVHFHIIYQKENYKGGYIPPEQIAAQMVVLNTAFSLPVHTGLYFEYGSTTYYKNATWFNYASQGYSSQDEMKIKTRKGGKRTLNIWTVGFTGSGLLGRALFVYRPWDDGIVVLFSSFPGGSTEYYNRGQTVTHEVGHWVGLYHTFQGGCDSPGDYVSDTPAEASPAFGCPKGRDTCTAPGEESPDPIENFMDYTVDACMNQFTIGQANRTRVQLKTYRDVRTGFVLP
ncbi:metalloprotease [Flagelloscypha sp. PMI_526]|nr:metalloprotease [Flagelloscypha sp. PMI_526]